MPAAIAPGLTRAERNIRWIEANLRVPKGARVGEPVRLMPFQKDGLRRIYDNPFVTDTAIWSFARKNAKTALAAMVNLLHLVGPEARINGELYSAAMDKEQASIVYFFIARMLDFSPHLDAYIERRDTKREMLNVRLGTKYSALSRESKTKLGMSPALVTFDELGEVEGPKLPLFDALTTAAGGEPESLTLIISTQAARDEDLLSILIDDARAGKDPHTVLMMHEAPEGCRLDDEAAILAANPAAAPGGFQNFEYTKRQVAKGIRIPTQEAAVRRYFLNQRVDVAQGFIAQNEWKACRGPEGLSLERAECYFGLDLSATSDLTAFVLVGRVDHWWVVEPHFWLPDDGLAERGEKDKRPYAMWRDQGLLHTTPGRTIDLELVAAQIRRIFESRNIVKGGFDRWHFGHLEPLLRRADFDPFEIQEKFQPFGQGFQSMGPACRALRRVIEDQTLAHGGNPILTFNAANAVATTDPAGNQKLDKNRARGRIDGLVALAMALSLAMGEAEEPQSYWEQVAARSNKQDQNQGKLPL